MLALEHKPYAPQIGDRVLRTHICVTNDFSAPDGVRRVPVVQPHEYEIIGHAPERNHYWLRDIVCDTTVASFASLLTPLTAHP